MKLAQVREVLRALVLVGEDRLEEEVGSACGCDLISDMLMHTPPRVVLLTGLTNPQVMRTAELIDVVAVVFVRGKRPSPECLQLAKESGIVVLCSDHSLFQSSGLLWSAGLQMGEAIEDRD